MQDITEFLSVLNTSVRSIVTLACVNEGSVDEWLLEDDLLVNVSIQERTLHCTRHGLGVLVDVLSTDESVSPNSVALVSPQSHYLVFFALVVLGLGCQNVLNDLGEVSHVELVEEFLRCGGELRVLRHVSEHYLSSLDNLRSLLLGLFIELLEVVDQQLRVNSGQDLLLGH